MLNSSLANAFFILLKREVVLGLRHSSELLNPLLFFLIVVTMFPLALGPEPQRLSEIAVAVIWVAAVLASSSSLDMMFRSDFDDGSLEQMLLCPYPTQVLVMAKVLAHWILSGAPLIFCAMTLGLFLYLPEDAVIPLLLTLILGTPVESLRFPLTFRTTTPSSARR